MVVQSGKKDGLEGRANRKEYRKGMYICVVGLMEYNKKKNM